MEKLSKAVNLFSWAVITAFGLLLLYGVWRVFICDQFIVPSNSMNPTLIQGDRILANKLPFGARIYKSFDFSKGAPLESWRMPRLRKIRPNDVLVFNVPNGYGGRGIGFKINYVYSKRCIGTPGDSIRIEKSIYKNNRYAGSLGLRSQQERLASTPDSLFYYPALHVRNFGGRWTIKEFGPLYVPARGDTILLDSMAYHDYRYVIEYETGKTLSLDGNRCLLDNAYLTHYIFENNYYFTGGDNVPDSKDSRYWGFVPEEFIIGVTTRILYSRDPYTGKFRWNRLLRKIDKDFNER